MYAIYTAYVVFLVFQNEEEVGPSVSGDLCMKVPWPGIARTIWGSHEDFLRIYFEPHPGKCSSKRVIGK